MIMNRPRTALLVALGATATSLLAAAPAFAADEPAGGAAIGQVVIATLGAMVVTAALLWLCAGHRNGTNGVLAWGAGIAERTSGLPGWAALPSAIATASLLCAVFGMYWDISLHIDKGRDEGPLANPAHYFILAGLFGIFAAGVVAIVLPKERPSASAIPITRDWHAPLGGVLIAACGAFALTGFPLDDVWHRLFGQDVTLWGPTHLMLIGGAGMTLIGIAVLIAEARRANAAAGGEREESRMARTMQLVALPGGLLTGLSVFQGEFDFGVPQFNFVFHPITIMVAAGVGLVAMRMFLGRGAAIGGVAFYLALKGILALFVGGIFGEVTPVMPLYLVEAVIIELVALRVPREQPLKLGLLCGALIGTVGLAAEWGWTHLVFKLPWTAGFFPEGVLFGFAAAVAGCVIGAWVGARLSSETVPRTPPLRNAALVAAAVIAAITVYSLDKPAQEGVTASVTLADASRAGGGDDRSAFATVTLNRPDAVKDAEFFVVTAWQGGGFKNIEMRRVGQATWRTAEPVPVSGDWKSILRISRDNTLSGMPIFLPRDTAIPADEVPALPRFERAFVPDHEILQREQKEGVAAALPPIAYAVVAAIALSLLVLIAWGLHRFALAAPGGSLPARGRAERTPRPAAKIATG
jgi:hypothetical protein